MLGTGVDGAQIAQTVTMHYADGTVGTFTQSFSDWFSLQYFPREAKGVQMAYRQTYNGSEGSGPLNLYEYTFPIAPGKTVESVTLPDNRHVVVVAITLDGDWR